jgi:N-acetylmuramoyl-L-alanine amidase
MMATPLTANQLIKALRAEGLDPRTMPGWSMHNRNHKGPWGPVHGVMIHHTAGRNSLRIVHEGRADLPGPLAHAHLAKDGTLTLTGHGRANHAGTIAANAHIAVITEDGSHPSPTRTETVDGNRHYYGFEIENLGDGKDPYPPVQYRAAVKYAAALCRAHGWTEHSGIGHKEVTRRKIDPTFDMGMFRRDVGYLLQFPAGKPGRVEVPTPRPEEPTMPGGRPSLLALASSAMSGVTPGAWHDVEFDIEHNDPSHLHAVNSHLVGREDAAYYGVLNLRVLNAEGAEIHVRLAEEDADGDDVKSHPIAEMIGNEGSTYFAAPFIGQLPDESGRRLKFQLMHNHSTPLTVERVELKSLWWLS